MRQFRHVTLSLIAALYLGLGWCWNVLAAIIEHVIQKLHLIRVQRALESFVERLPPWACFFLFVVPFAIAEVAKLYSLALIGQHHIFLGLALYIAMKIVGLSFCAYLFELTKPQLLKIGWFARIYGLLLRWSAWAKNMIAPYKAKLKIYRDHLRVIFRAWREKWSA